MNREYISHKDEIITNEMVIILSIIHYIICIEKVCFSYMTSNLYVIMWITSLVKIEGVNLLVSNRLYTKTHNYSTIFWWVRDCMQLLHGTCIWTASWLKINGDNMSVCNRVHTNI